MGDGVAMFAMMPVTLGEPGGPPLGRVSSSAHHVTVLNPSTESPCVNRRTQKNYRRMGHQSREMICFKF